MPHCHSSNGRESGEGGVPLTSRNPQTRELETRCFASERDQLTALPSYYHSSSPHIDFHSFSHPGSMLARTVPSKRFSSPPQDRNPPTKRLALLRVHPSASSTDAVMSDTEDELGLAVVRRSDRAKGKMKLRYLPELPEAVWTRVFELHYEEIAEGELPIRGFFRWRRIVWWMGRREHVE